MLCGSKLMKAPLLGYFDTQGGSKYQVQSLKSLRVSIQLRDFFTELFCGAVYYAVYRVILRFGSSLKKPGAFKNNN